MEQYPASDDFCTAALNILQRIEAATNEATTLTASAGFFGKRASAKKYRLMMLVADALYRPFLSAGVDLWNDAKLAEAYCRKVVRKMEPICIAEFNRNPNDVGTSFDGLPSTGRYRRAIYILET